MVELEKFNIEEIKEVYPLLYAGIFREYSIDGNSPKQVYLGKEEGKYIGLVAGYEHSPSTWYLQRGGFILSEQKKTKALSRLRSVLAGIHKEYKYIMTIVENTDLPALKIDLNAGYVIIGTRMDTTGKLWVEMIHTREEVDG